jgi:hypothetical protein
MDSAKREMYDLTPQWHKWIVHTPQYSDIDSAKREMHETTPQWHIWIVHTLQHSNIDSAKRALRREKYIVKLNTAME